MTKVTLESDEYLHSTVKKHKPKPSYQKIGNGTMNPKIKIKSIDLLKEVSKMTSDEKFCFFQIKDKIQYSEFDQDYIYQIKITSKNFSSSQKVMFSRGYKLLREKDLVRRIKRGTYMINPKGLVPNEFQDEYAIYEKAK